jgi:hypothetical protein
MAYTFKLRSVNEEGTPLVDGTCLNTPPSPPLDAISVSGNVVTANIKKPGQGVPYCFMLSPSDECWEPWSGPGLCETQSWLHLPGDKSTRDCPTLPSLATPWVGGGESSLTLVAGVAELSLSVIDPELNTIGNSIKCYGPFPSGINSMLLYVNAIDSSGLQESPPPYATGDSIYAWVDYVGGSFEILLFAHKHTGALPPWYRVTPVSIGENVITLPGDVAQIEFGLALRNIGSYASFALNYIDFS